MKLLLIRHGHCPPNGRSIAGRSPGVHLSEQGREEAERLIPLLRRSRPTAVFSSPLERARETIAPSAADLGLKVEVRDSFVELDFGEWTGKTFEELERDPDWHRFNTCRTSIRIPGGELIYEVQARALSELVRISDEFRGKTVVIVSHGDVIRTMIAGILGIPLDLMPRFEIAPGSLSEVEIDDKTGYPRLLGISN